MASTTFFETSTAPRGAYPLDKPLAATRMSGEAPDFPMVDGEIASGAAHAGHDFVGDEQDAVACGKFRRSLADIRRGNDRAERGAADWLRDEGCDFSFDSAIAVSTSAAYSCPQLRQPSLQS